MDRDIVEFGGGELRMVGGDYGQIVLEGTTPEARRACDALTAATRRRDDGVVIDCLIALAFDAPDHIENRHAGREGTPERGVDDGDRSIDDEERRLAESPAVGPAPRSE